MKRKMKGIYYSEPMKVKRFMKSLRGTITEALSNYVCHLFCNGVNFRAGFFLFILPG